jgi:hypothetical protein
MPTLRSISGRPRPFDDSMDPRARGSFQVPQGPPEDIPRPEGPVGPEGPEIPIPPGDDARSGESGRERAMTQQTPRKPMEPTPMAGSGMTVSPPMPQMPMEALTSTLRGRGNFGGAGGLTQGGFGLPFDPTSNQQSDPISGLLSMLKKPSNGAF